MNWSQYQNNIFDRVERTRDNLAINAVAGSGKTSTLVEIYNRLPRRSTVVFLAFNRHIVAELGRRLPGCEVLTIHSLGYKAIRAAKRGARVSEHKVKELIDEDLRRNPPRWLPEKFYGAFLGLVRDVVAKSRLTLTDLSNAEQSDAMLSHFGLWADMLSIANEGDIHPDLISTQLIRTAKRIRKESNRLYERYGVVDFDDMLYIPVAYGLPVAQYDVVLVDEAQDMNAAQLEIVVKAKAAKGRIISVGDPRQAIMGFAGADNESFAKIVARTKAIELPLSVCYRCPASHIELAKAIVPQIEAAPGADQGVIEDITMAQFINMPHSGDLIICRTNAPLVGVALKLIANGIQARIRGRNIAAGLVKLIKDAAKLGLGEGHFAGAMTDALERLVDIRLSILQAKPNTEMAQETLQDQKDCILAFLEGRPTIANVDDLCNQLEALFADEGAAVWLSSIHRSKGLEAERTFLIRSDALRITRQGMLAWQEEQEANLEYVALTRAKRYMYRIPTEKKAA